MNYSKLLLTAILCMNLQPSVFAAKSKKTEPTSQKKSTSKTKVLASSAITIAVALAALAAYNKSKKRNITQLPSFQELGEDVSEFYKPEETATELEYELETGNLNPGGLSYNPQTIKKF